MRKIANTTELQTELQRILAYAESDRPSRMRLARELRKLSKRVNASGWDGKLVGKACRLSWTVHGFLLEELQVKGKKKLRRATLQRPTGPWSRNLSAYIAENIIQQGGVTANDSYDDMKRKIEGAYKEANKSTIADNQGSKLDWLDTLKWYEEEIHYLKVIPEGTDPIIAKGKDFEIKVTWTSFSHTIHYNDDPYDPSYTQYASSSAASGRKLYQLLKAQPDALKSVTSQGFSKWLTDNKIGFKTNFSVWR